MRRWSILLAISIVFTACAEPREPAAPVDGAGAEVQALLGSDLEGALAGASEDDTLEVIVNYDESLTTMTELTNAIVDLGAGVIQFNNLSMVASLATPSQILTMETLTGVDGVYLNAELDWMLAEGVETIRADEVHANGVTGDGVGIAILDSGIDGLHPDLAYPSKTVQNVKYIANVRDVYYFDGRINGTIRSGADLFVEDVENSETSIGHGTHVAGIAAGGGDAAEKYTGVAPGADLIGIGTGDVLFIFWALAGFDYILDNQEEYNIQVVNNSWGSSGEFDADHPINEATREVYDEGVTVVFAAGNCGSGEDLTCPEPGENQVNPYSAAPWVISVAAGCKLVDDPTNSADHCDDPTGAGRDGILADFSSRGLPGDELHHPDVTAPGVHIVSARASTGTVMNGLDANHDVRICNISTEDETYYTCASGTSMASPHVAGVVALLEEASGGTLTPDEALDAMTSTAKPLPEFELWEVGTGYVDALAAVEAVQN